MPHIRIVVCVFLLCASSISAESDPTSVVERIFPDAMDVSRPKESREALLDLVRHLHESPESASAVRDLVAAELPNTDDPETVERLALICHRSADETILSLLAFKLGEDKPETTRLAACSGLATVRMSDTLIASSATGYVLAQLERILSNGNNDQRLIDQAAMATANCGHRGFDLLFRVGPGTGHANVKTRNIFYTALAATGDARACPLILAALDSPETRLGMRIQAAHAVGSLFHAMASRGVPITGDQRAACDAALSPYLKDSTPDQLFSVALRSLQAVSDVGSHPVALGALDAALSSASGERRAAAVETLYQSSTQMCAVYRSTIEQLAASDPNAVVRTSAEAVLNRLVGESK